MGRDITHADREAMRAARKDLQIVSVGFPTQQEATSGVIYVTFSSLGSSDR